MAQTRDWKSMQTMSARLLEERTGEGVAVWNRRIKKQGFKDEKALRGWLTGQGVTGYAQTMLVMEQFGYPDFFLASADELTDGQYADRPHLRPILDALLDAAAGLGEVTIQTRKTYISATFQDSRDDAAADQFCSPRGSGRRGAGVAAEGLRGKQLASSLLGLPTRPQTTRLQRA
jgi:hypothetical protein